MSRSIKDSIVEQNLISSLVQGDLNEELYDAIQREFSGKVKDNLETVKLEKSRFGLPKINATESLDRQYEQIKLEGKDCYVQFAQSRKLTVSGEELRVMKVLCVEQINASPTYSKILAAYFMHMISKVANTPDPLVGMDLTNEEKGIMQSVNIFVQKHVSKDYLITLEDEIVQEDAQIREVGE